MCMFKRSHFCIKKLENKRARFIVPQKKQKNIRFIEFRDVVRVPVTERMNSSTARSFFSKVSKRSHQFL